jgi:parallel beta-helix repeat protein
VTVTGNTASAFDTGAGGGISHFLGTLILDDSHVTFNHAVDGGIWSELGTVTLTNGSTVTDNTATANGGGIYLDGGNSLSVHAGCRVTDNSANLDGGGISSPNGSFVTLSAGSLVCANSAPQCTGFTPPAGFCGACPS